MIRRADVCFFIAGEKPVALAGERLRLPRLRAGDPAPSRRAPPTVAEEGWLKRHPSPCGSTAALQTGRSASGGESQGGRAMPARQGRCRPTRAPFGVPAWRSLKDCVLEGCEKALSTRASERRPERSAQTQGRGGERVQGLKDVSEVISNDLGGHALSSQLLNTGVHWLSSTDEPRALELNVTLPLHALSLDRLNAHGNWQSTSNVRSSQISGDVAVAWARAYSQRLSAARDRAMWRR